MLQVVMGLCNQTLRQSADLRQFENLFLGRVQALARVYEVLQRDGWTRVSVHELIDGIVSRVLSAAHYELEGPPAYIAADAATGFGLLLHELAEGARKRGVAESTGRLQVRWEVTEEGEPATRSLMVHWRERVSVAKDLAALTNGTFERLQRQLRHEFNGSLLVETTPGVVDIKLEVPLKEHERH